MKNDKKYETSQHKKTMFHSSHTNANQTQTWLPKKNKAQGSPSDHPATGVNTIEVSKKGKDKDIDKKNSHDINYNLISKRVTILTNPPKNQKTSSGLGYFYVNNLKNRKIRIRVETRTLYSVSRDLQGPN